MTAECVVDIKINMAPVDNQVRKTMQVILCTFTGMH